MFVSIPDYEIDVDRKITHKQKNYFKILYKLLKTYLPLIRFSASSLISAGIDYFVLILIQFSTGNLLFSAIIARVSSSTFNYTFNKYLVFCSKENIKNSFFKYFGLVIIVFMFNYSFLYLYFKILFFPLVISKILTETTVFLFSYWTQKKFIFKKI